MSFHAAKQIKKYNYCDRKFKIDFHTQRHKNV